MASALEKLMKGTLQKSDSQKAFSPWWEGLEDKLLYSMMILGMISLPFNMVSNTPVECTLNQYHASYTNLTVEDRRPMRYHHFYLRKFCTMNFIDDTMIFLPFILLLAPLPLVGTGRMCLQYFRVQKRMDAFYNLLVKDSLDREDVEAMEKENMRNSHEVLQMFQESNGIYYSYITKSVIQLVTGGFIAVTLVWVHLYGLSGEEIECIVFEKHYKCVVPLATFYHWVIIISNTSILLYLMCNIYTFLWILFPRFSPFYRLMQKSKEHVNLEIDFEQVKVNYPKTFLVCNPTAENAEPFFDIYFDLQSRDLGLLITLLACRNGAPEGLRFVSLFDKEYKALWKPLQVDVHHDAKKEQVIHVEWNDAPIASFIHGFKGRMPKMRVEYTLEITPDISEGPLKTHKFFKDENNSKFYAKMPLEEEKEPQKEFKYKDSFHGVDVERPKRPKLVHQPCSIRTLSGGEYFNNDENKKRSEYRIIISTEVNGRTIAQKTVKVPPPPILVESKSSHPSVDALQFRGITEERDNYDPDCIPL